MQAVIMAGGKGTRLLPLTAEMPKPMVPLLNRPVLAYTIALLRKNGFDDIGITVGHMADKITEYFGDGSKYGVKLTYFYEEEPLGTAGGVKRAYPYVEDTFLVISGDIYTEADIRKATLYHRAKNSPCTLIVRPHDNPVGLGTVEIDFNNRVTAFREKPLDPKPSLINTGIYILQKGILNLIPDGFYDFGKNLFPSIANRCYAYLDYSYWSDIGTLVHYYQTNAYLAAEYEKAVPTHPPVSSEIK